MLFRISELASASLTLSSEILGNKGLPWEAFPTSELRTIDEEGDMMPLDCVDGSPSAFPSKLAVVLSEGRTNSP